MKSYKPLFSRALSAAPGRLHFAAHSHHLWPDASFEGHVRAWEDAALLADRKWEKIFGEVIPAAQREVAAELNLPSAEGIAFAPNTHELLVRLFSAWSGRRPIEVVTSDGEFHSFRRQSLRWSEAGCVRLHTVPCEPFSSFTERFLAKVAEIEPDIVFVSQVMFKSGLRFDGAAELAARARPHGPWVALDLYHAFMAAPYDFSALADRVFLLGGGYKYAMAGESAAFMQAPPSYALRPVNTGWFADFGAIEARQGEIAYAPGGGRFMGATFDPSGLYRFTAVREMLAREGLTTRSISDRLAALRAVLCASIEAGEAGVLREAEILSPNAEGYPARFIALRSPRATAWKAKLFEHDIITDARDDVLRIGLGLYLDEDDLDAFCAGAKRALAGG